MKLYILWIILLAILAGLASKAQDIVIRKDTTITGIWSIPAETIIRFESGGHIHGTGTIRGGIIQAALNQWIFDTTLTVEPAGLYGKDWSSRWFGAKETNTDNWSAIQKSIYTCSLNRIRNCFLPRGAYHISRGLQIQFIYKGQYAGVSIHFYGESEFWDERTTLIQDNLNELYCIGLQVGKGTEIDHLTLRGQFQSPTTTGAEYYNTPIASFGSPQLTYGLIVDYDGTKNPSGSTGCKFHDLIINNFQVGISVSPNPATFNADILLFDNIHLGDLRVGFQSSQAQEKGNEIHGLWSWGRIHTLIQIGQTWKAQGAGYTIDLLNVANACIRLFDIRQSGWYSTHVSNLFGESVGSIGNISTGDSKGSPPFTLSHSTIHFALVSVCGVQNLLTTNSPQIKLEDCNLRYYGQSDTLHMSGLATFINCNFSGPIKNGTSGSMVMRYGASPGKIQVAIPLTE